MIGIIILALKFAIKIFFNPFITQQTVLNMYTQVARVQSCAGHMQTHQAPITCNMTCATYYEGTAQLLSFDRVEVCLF